MITVSNMLLNRLLHHFAQTEQFAFFDTSKPGEDNPKSYLFERPVTRLQCGVDEDATAFLMQVEKWLGDGFYVAGWFGYEFGALLLGHLSGLTSKPGEGQRIVADLGVYGEPAIFDHQNGNCTFQIGNQHYQGEYSVSGLHPNITEKEYLEAIDAVQEYISAGDTYQVNYTLKLLFDFAGSPEGMYKELRRNQSVAYGSYIRWGDERVMSFSPELFFRKRHTGLTVRPMKGTLKRGRNSEEDAQACAFLHNDQKNRSENVMIVDLLRNDLGRVLHEAGGGEVKVASLFDVETYESLLQMTSTIDGDVSIDKMSSVSLPALFQALFPCGSITGAPKIRTMEIIDELEKEARGVYTGAIGFLTPDGEGVFNVPIRTVVLNGKRGEMGIGSGITHDSDPGDEWRECLLKGRFLTDPTPEFELIETLLWQEGIGYLLFEEHVDRLCSSAEYFYFSFDREKVKQSLIKLAEEQSGNQRVRLTLAKDGHIELTSVACELPQHIQLPASPEPAQSGLPYVVFSEMTIDSASPWFMHKTTRREVYNSEFGAASNAGALDCLFLNEKSQVTEGAITNLFIYKSGKYYTPPIECGLLAGTMRRYLLQEQNVDISEIPLTIADVRNADAVFVCNSVRGVIQVRV